MADMLEAQIQVGVALVESRKKSVAKLDQEIAVLVDMRKSAGTASANALSQQLYVKRQRRDRLAAELAGFELELARLRQVELPGLQKAGPAKR